MHWIHLIAANDPNGAPPMSDLAVRELISRNLPEATVVTEPTTLEHELFALRVDMTDAPAALLIIGNVGALALAGNPEWTDQFIAVVSDQAQDGDRWVAVDLDNNLYQAVQATRSTESVRAGWHALDDAPVDLQNLLGR